MEMQMSTTFCYGDLKGKHHLENIVVDGRIILKLTLVE
jgi:hypothetical protein